MIDELILHIGMPKTGTTSIQRALHRAGGGKDWTYVNLNPPHSANPVILRAHGGIAPASIHPGPRSAQNKVAARALLSEALLQVKTPRAILSAEAMVRLPPAAVAGLLDQVSGHARKIRAVAYIRPPISFITSYVQQFYKTGHEPLMDVLRRAQRPVPADIALWDHALGVDKVQLFPFEPEAFNGGTVVQHFAKNLRLGALPEQGHNANVSLCAEATRLLVQYRRLYPGRHPLDGQVLSRLGTLTGAPFRLHPDALADAIPLARATYGWAEGRMGWDMKEPAPRPWPRAIGNDADFDDILPDTLDWLAANSGVKRPTLEQGGRTIGDAVAMLRHGHTGRAPLRQIVQRLRLA